MGKIRTQKRKLARLSNKPSFIKSYNHNVRKNNKNVEIQRKKNKRFEYLISLVIFIVFGIILSYKLWLSR